MTKGQIEVGGVYICKVSGILTKVRVTQASPYGGWVGINVKTGREVRLKTAARLRRVATA